jgi:serine phosphatase RsbU (regulator of sigma subunit)
MNGSAAIDWGQAALVMPGQTQSGDRGVIAVTNGTALIAVIDGIGHGEEAAAAANAAATVLETSPQESLRTLFDRCHVQLRATRGAAMTVARFESHERTLDWLGTGNVKAVLLRRSAHGFTCTDLLTYSGVVGAQVTKYAASQTEVASGDVLILATDGVDRKFIDSIRYDEAPQAQAERLLAAYRSPTDDALVLVARLGR